MPEPLIEEIGGHLAAVLQQAKNLRVDVREAERARRKASILNLAVLLILALGLVAVGGLAWQNNQLAHRVDTGNARMVDCTTPGGRCYEEGRTRTNGAVAAVVRVSVFVSQCGRLYPGESGPEYDKKLNDCVAQRLAQAATQPAPSTGP